MLISADDVSDVRDPNGRYFGNERCDCSPVCQEPLLPKARYSPTLTIEGQTPAFVCGSEANGVRCGTYDIDDNSRLPDRLKRPARALAGLPGYAISSKP